MYEISAERLDNTARALMERHSSAVWERMPPVMQGRYRDQVINTICSVLDISRADIQIVPKTSDINCPG